jgi:hypothetical protein
MAVRPNSRVSRVKLVLAQSISAAIPVHCNEKANVTRTSAAPESVPGESADFQWVTWVAQEVLFLRRARGTLW